MRENARALVRAFARAFRTPEPIVEIGALQVPGQEGFADLRPFFPDKTYIGCDLRPGRGVDRIDDAHRLSWPDGSVGTVITVDTLEHVERPFAAMAEIRRVLRPDGMVLMVSVMDFPIHDHPSDYWRFTPAGFQLLLEGFAFRLVGYEGEALKPHTVVGVGACSPPPEGAVADFLALTPNTVWERS